MLHIATSHHRSADWIEIQRRFLDRFVDEPFQLWGSLEDVDPARHRHFDHVVPSLGERGGKLNLLGRLICDAADPDDLLVFLDGDAFPVRPFLSDVRASLAAAPLTAVQRLEDGGDGQPHPSFCATTVGFWADLPGDWLSGHVLANGRTGVGANLLHRLETTGNAWVPIVRTHDVDDHPVRFGVYGGFLYHHGAGFARVKTPWGARTVAGEAEPVREKPILRRRGEKLAEAVGDERFKEIVARALELQAQTERVYAAIRDDPSFFDALVGADAG